MKCPNCKKEIENGSAFCEHCGARVKKSKKGLWITLSVVFVAIIATIVVTTIQEQQEQIAREQYLAAQYQRDVERQLQAERKAREEAERQAELARKEAARNAELARQEAARKAKAERQAELLKYVNLGLPSGTCWRNSNEGGDNARYTYNEAVSRFGNKLPTKQQFVELKNKCTWTWTDHGYKVIGPNGNSIYLPAAGDRYCEGFVYGVGTYGVYWSSTPYDSDNACCLYFDSSKVYLGHSYLCYGQSVRLVQ